MTFVVVVVALAVLSTDSRRDSVAALSISSLVASSGTIFVNIPWAVDEWKGLSVLFVGFMVSFASRVSRNNESFASMEAIGVVIVDEATLDLVSVVLVVVVDRGTFFDDRSAQGIFTAGFDSVVVASSGLGVSTERSIRKLFELVMVSAGFGEDIDEELGRSFFSFMDSDMLSDDGEGDSGFSVLGIEAGDGDSVRNCSMQLMPRLIAPSV
jgi:hypothetical protein